MDQSCLEVVRELTEEVIAQIRPEKLPDFDDDFAAFALVTGAMRVSEKGEFFQPRDQSLDTTLVAGMFFQVLVEAAALPAGTRRERVSFIRKRAKDYLVHRLAGQITLSQFYRLLNLIEEKAEHYFQRLEQEWAAKPVGEIPQAPLRPEAVHGEELRRALSRVPLPLKGRRKLTPETLWGFLCDTQGRWFRLLDLEGAFKVNKKTAWSYLNLLLTEGILEHNGEKANRVRYALAGCFRLAPPH
jgi:hypothetical protein